LLLAEIRKLFSNFLLAACYLLLAQQVAQQVATCLKKTHDKLQKVAFLCRFLFRNEVKFKSGLRFMLGGGKINQLERKGLCDF